MKLITWNVNQTGKERQGVWDLLKREDADIVLLQEVKGLPDPVPGGYKHYRVFPRDADGYGRQYSAVVLSKGVIDSTGYLESTSAWVNQIFSDCPGWIVESQTTLPSGEHFRVVVVHSPHLHIPRKRWDGVDVAGIKATNAPDIWFTEILWGLLRDTVNSGDDANWIVAGDFNSSVLFDVPKDWGNREFICRMNSIGLVDCLSDSHGEPVPTFQNKTGEPGKRLIHQLDYCFVSPPLRARLSSARVAPRASILDTTPRLSDHLPILCDFK